MTEREPRTRSDLTKVDAHHPVAADYDDAPELTDEQLANAVVSPAARRGRPPIPNPKVPVKLRLDAEIVEGYRATGPGWQTRINDILGRALKRGAPVVVRERSKDGKPIEQRKTGSKPAAPRKRA